MDEGDRCLVAAVPDHPVAEADILVRDLHDVHQSGLKKAKPFTGLRLFNIFGPLALLQRFEVKKLSFPSECLSVSVWCYKPT